MKVKLAKILKVVGDEQRLRILKLIFSRKKICVSDIASKLGFSVAIVSHHLRALSKADLLSPMREGKRTCYMFIESGLAGELKKIIRKYK